ncbi:hypothetical protein HJG60_010428 [Phyllostomus discolor]|uniref:Uncharacterized protein n=1 Tax=Phyllostomus discolor TaxID=89673 RepID=A0A834EHD9_9CHIR|nr:hypothetical protein HJG60_010428 [Phyllostomus discolor]
MHAHSRVQGRTAAGPSGRCQESTRHDPALTRGGSAGVGAFLRSEERQGCPRPSPPSSTARVLASAAAPASRAQMSPTHGARLGFRARHAMMARPAPPRSAATHHLTPIQAGNRGRRVSSLEGWTLSGWTLFAPCSTLRSCSLRSAPGPRVLSSSLPPNATLSPTFPKLRGSPTAEGGGRSPASGVGLAAEATWGHGRTLSWEDRAGLGVGALLRADPTCPSTRGVSVRPDDAPSTNRFLTNGKK